MTPRLKERYRNEVVPALVKEFKYKNIMAVPRLRKIVVNMGLGEAIQNAKLLDAAGRELGQISGQKPVITRARKSIANFKLRKNMPIGAMVTLRGDRMYEFFDRLANVALPRVRDFRGLSTRAFDGRGNYTLGLRDQLVFPEVDYAKVEKVKGMNISIVTAASSGSAFPARGAAAIRRRAGRSERGRIAGGANFDDGQIGQETEVQDSFQEPMPHLWPPPGVFAQVPDVPFVLPAAGAQG